MIKANRVNEEEIETLLGVIRNALLCAIAENRTIEFHLQRETHELPSSGPTAEHGTTGEIVMTITTGRAGSTLYELVTGDHAK